MSLLLQLWTRQQSNLLYELRILNVEIPSSLISATAVLWLWILPGGNEGTDPTEEK
jgi:hypothetical protein